MNIFDEEIEKLEKSILILTEFSDNKNLYNTDFGFHIGLKMYSISQSIRDLKEAANTLGRGLHV